ncbi:MAG TPA: amino acid permease [Solirubrobacteraceae bacterium]|nr:amino acid permease [Solirubrobacteraceae bacterium]
MEAPRDSRGTESNELAGFGYKQELHRSLGSFSSFAAGFSYISILTGVIQLFAFGFAFAGPAVWWTWLIVLGGQMMVALCFAEMAGQYPLAGSVYNWSKRVAGDFSAWMTGWIYVIGSIVTVAAVAVAWQVVLPQVSTSFQFLGSTADAGTYVTKGGAQNALLLGAILVVFGTIVNMLGVKIMARINNFGVFAELIGSTILVILLLFHITRGPGIVVHNLGLGAGHKWGYFGAFIIGGIMSAYVMYGFDTAGTLAEETSDPRRNAPPAILRALGAAALIGGLLILLAVMDVKNIHDPNIGLLGLPYILKQALGSTAGKVFLVDSAVAITVCTLAVMAGCIRLMFAMARDGRLPFGSAIAHVSGHRRVPIVPALVVGILSLALLAVNIGNQSAFLALTSVAIVMFYIAYLGVTGGMLLRRLRGTWPKPDHGPYFSLGRFGLLVNVLAVAYGAIVAVNIAWPRAAVYDALAGTKDSSGHVIPGHWYWQYIAILFIGIVFLIGSAYYFAVYRRKPISVLREHAADVPMIPETPLAEAAP